MECPQVFILEVGELHEGDKGICRRQLCLDRDPCSPAHSLGEGELPVQRYSIRDHIVHRIYLVLGTL